VTENILVDPDIYDITYITGWVLAGVYPPDIGWCVLDGECVRDTYATMIFRLLSSAQREELQPVDDTAGQQVEQIKYKLPKRRVRSDAK
jgi:hypothetical protein